MVVQKNVALLDAARIVMQQKVEKIASVTVFVLTTRTILARVDPVSQVRQGNNEWFPFINVKLSFHVNFCFFPQGDQYSNCAEMIAKNPSGTCYNHGVRGKKDENCCESCKGVEIDSECPTGDYYNNCATIVERNPTKTCSQSRRDKCCQTCKGISVDARCPQGNNFDNCEQLIAQHGKQRVCADARVGPGCCSSCL